jgi:phosphomannomutase
VSELIISVSGLRGIVGETLTAEVAQRFARAWLASGLPAGPVIVARDGRASGPDLANAVANAVLVVGRNCFYADVAATPTVGRLVKEHQAAGGVQVSASHNPVEWNGLKLFGADGRVIPASAGLAVIERFRNSTPVREDGSRTGSPTLLADTTSGHLAAVLATVNPEAIRKRQFKVVLDANHGSGAVLGRRLLEALGCEITIHGEQPTGQFLHRPEPTADNLREVARQSVSAGADAVFCQDPDADRLAIIDAAGRYIGEEYTLALVLEHVLARNKGQPDGGGHRGEAWLYVFAVGRRRGERHGRDDPAKGGLRRRRQWRADRSACGPRS